MKILENGYLCTNIIKDTIDNVKNKYLNTNQGGIVYLRKEVTKKLEVTLDVCYIEDDQLLLKITYEKYSKTCVIDIDKGLNFKDENERKNVMNFISRFIEVCALIVNYEVELSKIEKR